MERLSWVPDDVDLNRPSAARVYDFYLGGSHNFAVDRAMGRQVIQFMPEVPRIARANRAFLRRAVEYLVAAGVRQFLDIGSGIPTAGNVHEIAQHADPAVRVAYVDIDPVAVAHSRTILRANDRTAVVQADLRQPDQVLAGLDKTALFDLDQPVAILVISMLHFVPDSDDPTGVVAEYRDAVAPGSYLALSHIHKLAEPVPHGDDILDVYARVGTPLTPRTEAELMAFFDGFELVEPGLVGLPSWHPDSPEDVERAGEMLRRGFRVGIGRKPGPGEQSERPRA
ncbi:MAG TPA: SAM-dependent methyltransferase [Pilimelia sp.]|nr:SAM-dependent methyltransferase [Pilimelia sp.]